MSVSYQTEAKPQCWRAVAIFDDRSDQLLYLHRSSPQVRAGYLAPYRDWQSRVAIHRFVQDIPLSPRHPSYAALSEIEGMGFLIVEECRAGQKQLLTAEFAERIRKGRRENQN